MPHPRSVLGGSTALAVLIFGLWRCHAPESKTTAAEPANSEPAALASPSALTAGGLAGSTRDSVPSATAAPSPEALAAPAPSASAALPAEPSEPYGSTDNVVNDVAKRLDPHDLTLYSQIERELRRDVPKEVHDLVASKKQGATRAQLTSQIQKTISNLQLRTLLVTWLDDSFGSAARPQPPAPGVASGSATVHVKPLKARQ